MATVPHVRISALGKLGTNSGERFTYTLAMAAEPGFQDNLVQIRDFFSDPNRAFWNDAAADIRAFHSNPFVGIHNDAVLEEVKFASIGPDGKYNADPVIVNIADANGGGGLIARTLPQSALCISLGTARRGATGRGRFYVPMPNFELDRATLQIGGSATDDVRIQARNLIQNLNNQPGLDGIDLVVSVVSSKGYATPVNSVRVGKVIDTIRSRRAQLPEAYGTPLPVAAPS